MANCVMSSAIVAVVAASLAACSSMLDVPPPKGLRTSGELDSRSGAEARYFLAKAETFSGLARDFGLIELNGLFTDEFENGSALSGSGSSAVDARITASPLQGFSATTTPLLFLFSARSNLLLTAPYLLKYEAAADQKTVGEAYALAGYIEVFLAESYCAGVTLDRVLPDGGWEWGMPLTTDSLFKVAESHFALALEHAADDPTVIALANAGLARARLGRGAFAEASTAAALVPASFSYNIESSLTNSSYRNFYTENASFCSNINTADSEGGNGINFLSAHDPRLVVDSMYKPTCDLYNAKPGAKKWYYPVKFGQPSQSIPLATSLQARLIVAEAALKAGDMSWLTILNDLRANSGVAGLAPLSDPGSVDASVDLLFRERAFWLYSTGTRIGDLRRLVRHYDRPANSVYPTGTYFGGQVANYPLYGNDVSMTLPLLSANTIRNPNYVGCLTSTETP